MQTPDSQVIVERFFQALETLKAEGRVRGIKTFTERYGVDRRNLYRLMKNTASDMFQPAWLAYLVRDYGVSARWLLTGTGNILSRN